MNSRTRFDIKSKLIHKQLLFYHYIKKLIFLEYFKIYNKIIFENFLYKEKFIFIKFIQKYFAFLITRFIKMICTDQNLV